MKVQDLKTKEENTWCPGCTNFALLQTVQEALVDLINQKKIKHKDIAMASGIGCHAKVFDYINVNGFYSLHGRVLPTCLGMKAANPELTVIGFGGDGDTYAEGVSHLVHNCRYNSDFTMIVYNNKVFALTTGQATPTSERGFVGGSTPFGVKEDPLNPIALALVSGATFIARGYVLERDHLRSLVKQAVTHKGFALIDILQPCLTYNNPIAYFQKNIYKLGKSHDTSDFKKALARAMEWDYSFKKGGKIPIGVFYKIKKPTLEEQRPQFRKPWYRVKREIKWNKIIKQFQ